MVFPRTLCDDISSSDSGATGTKPFSPSLYLPLFGNSNNWFGVHSPRGSHGLVMCHIRFFGGIGFTDPSPVTDPRIRFDSGT
ncbi:hypothetical protein AVEN_120741-1 [Araneus ventricosus]|uniref:Uncharacterized protein n=1 Tax=Araneus ventricosus TaxID=182803 RepID=A0A4Y2VIZ1_ARAVE|nr:hypothetical protein AVEN_120741-1 [Araneus ventricosus]